MKRLQTPIGILGYGIEGQSTLRYLQSIGVDDIVVLDKNPINSDLLDNLKTVQVFTGEQYLEALKFCKTVIRSAGVYPLSKELRDFQNAGGFLSSQVELFLEEVPLKNCVGVTGTLGKGSCVSMIAHILKSKGVLYRIGGNFGVPVLDLLLESPKLNIAETIFILELSSFQLMTVSSSPAIAVLLRVTSEHLDWHKDLQEYHHAKANLFRYQDSKGICIYFDGEKNNQKWIEESTSTWWSFGGKASDAKIEEGVLSIQNESLKLKELKVQALFQLENMAAASLACMALGVPASLSFKALKTYESLEFRMQFKGNFEGIDFFNDSYATRPDASIAAIQSMQKPFHIILGGSEKHADFTELAEVLTDSALLQTVFLIGETAMRLHQNISKAEQSKGLRLHVLHCESLETAFQKAVELKDASAVLLSPACASFGLFKNYKERGEAFNKLIDQFKIKEV